MPTTSEARTQVLLLSLVRGRPQNGHLVFHGFPRGAWWGGPSPPGGQAVGCCAKLFLEWNSRRSWSGAWHRNPTCFVSGIRWRAGHVAACVRPEPEDPRAPPGLLPSCSVALPPPIPSFLGMAVSEPELPSPDAQVSGWPLTPSPYRQKGHEPDSGPCHGQSMLCPPLQHRAGPVCLGSPCLTLTAPWLTVHRDSKCLAT